MKVDIGSPQYLEHKAEIEELAAILSSVTESTGAGGRVVIGALTMLLALWLDEAPDSVANEIRARVVSVLKGHVDG